MNKNLELSSMDNAASVLTGVGHVFAVHYAKMAEMVRQTGKEKLAAEVEYYKMSDDAYKQHLQVSAQQQEVAAAAEIKAAVDLEDKKEKLRSDSFKRYSEQLDQAREQDRERQKQDYAQLGASMGTIFGQAIGDGGKGALKKALKEMLKLELSYLESKLAAKVFENAVTKFGSMGVPGLVIAAAESGAVYAAFEIAKGVINKFSVGTPFSPGGMALVGERGPELVHLPQGSQVYTTTETNNIMNKNMGFTVHIHGSNGATDEVLTDLRAGNAEKLVNYIQERMGN